MEALAKMVSGWLLGKAAPPPPKQLFLGLMLSATKELEADGYARVPLTLTEVEPLVLANAERIEFAHALSDWPQFTRTAAFESAMSGAPVAVSAAFAEPARVLRSQRFVVKARVFKIVLAQPK